MDKNMKRAQKTRELLIKHYQTYPKLQIEDVFKFLFQSAFGCEHLMSDRGAVLERIKCEYESATEKKEPFTDRLDGAYSRVHLSRLSDGLTPETLSSIFCLSSKNESDGMIRLEEKLTVARELVLEGVLPLGVEAFDRMADEWRGRGYPAIHHSPMFREEYSPAYRVIHNRYADLLPLFSKIDRLLGQGMAIVALEGGSASGKTTLSGILEQVYDCNVFHMDDFFLRPEQRTPCRLAEVGGNVDRERFTEEVLRSLKKKEAVCYRPFNCASRTLGEPITVIPKRLTVVEGVYSMHPAFGKYYDLSVFLDICPEYQKERIQKRNSPALATRFFNEWIPPENTYFRETGIKERSDLVLFVR